MEWHGSDHGGVIDIDSLATKTDMGGIKACVNSGCGFSVRSTSNDAKERSASSKKLVIAVVLCAVFMSIEVIGGIKANSLAILTDAAHLLSDVAAFAISLFSIWASGWEATPRQTYGFHRIEILGAFVSIQLIWLLTGILIYEAFVRLINKTGEINGFLMFVVSAFGLVVNIVMALLLGHEYSHGHGHGHGHSHSHDHDHDHGILGTYDHNEEHNCGHNQINEDHGLMHNNGIDTTNRQHHHDHEVDQSEPLLIKNCSNEEHETKNSLSKKKQFNINVEGAYLHVVGDAIQSIGVMIGGAIIWYKPEWKIVDLLCTLVFSAIVLFTTIRMLRNILEVLMESAPREIDATKLEKSLCEMEEVVAVHELHIWAITMGKVLLACHVKIKHEADADFVLDKVIDHIRREYNISHVTIQIERQ